MVEVLPPAQDATSGGGADSPSASNKPGPHDHDHDQAMHSDNTAASSSSHSRTQAQAQKEKPHFSEGFHHIPSELYDVFRQIIREELDHHRLEGQHHPQSQAPHRPQGDAPSMTGSQLRREPFGDFASVYRNGQWHTVLAPAGTASAQAQDQHGDSDNNTNRQGGTGRFSSHSRDQQQQNQQDGSEPQDIEHQAGNAQANAAEGKEEGEETEEESGSQEATPETPSPSTHKAPDSSKDDALPSATGEHDHQAGTEDTDQDGEGAAPMAEGQPNQAPVDPRHLPPKEVLMHSADLLNNRKTMARPDGVLTAEPAILHDLERRVESLHGIQRTFPNPIARLRYEFREPLAEFLGSFVLLCFGLGVSTQVTLSSLSGSPAGSALSKAMTWGIGTGIGIWTSGGVSGGHLNPAITIALATHRGFPLWRIASYIFAQVLGGYVAALCIYGVYRHIITVTDPDLTMSSAAGWVTNPIAQVVEPATVGARISVFWNEVLGSALLMVSAFAAGDAHNSPPPEGMGPMLLLWSIMGILLSFSFLDGASLNPARDFGPRLALYTVGYSREDLWISGGLYWLWGAILGPIIGTQLGATMYDVAVYQGAEALVNKPFKVPGISNTSDGHFIRVLVKALYRMRLSWVIRWFLPIETASRAPTREEDAYPEEKPQGYWDDEAHLSHHQHQRYPPHYSDPYHASTPTLHDEQSTHPADKEE